MVVACVFCFLVGWHGGISVQKNRLRLIRHQPSPRTLILATLTTIAGPGIAERTRARRHEWGVIRECGGAQRQRIDTAGTASVRKQTAANIRPAPCGVKYFEWIGGFYSDEIKRRRGSIPGCRAVGIVSRKPSTSMQCIWNWPDQEHSSGFEMLGEGKISSI